MSRKEAEDRGRRAERLAALWLRMKGYRILGHRVRTPVGEIDLVVRRGRSLAFVEVKARDGDITADAALAPHQLKRVGRAASLLLGRYMKDCVSARIDAVIIARGRLPRHIEGVVDGDWR